MFKKLNLMNKRFGRLVVLKKSDIGKYKWLCLCDCGNEIIVTTSSLRSGNTKSCGCLHKEKSSIRISKLNKQRKVDLTELKFSRLSVLEEYNEDGLNKIKWLCKCSCGNNVIVSTGNLKNGSTKSCGCLHRERTVKFNKRIYSKETKQKMSEAQKKRNPVSEKTRKKISKANSGKSNGMYGKCGPSAPGWKGGISCEPYCDVWLDKEFKESIKERDDYQCQNLDCWRNCNHLPLAIHHIDMTRKIVNQKI